MIDFNTAINLIKQNGGFAPNSREDSFYRTYTTQGSRPMQVRISNHGTHLRTWYDKGYNPAYSINICIVYSADGSYDSNVNVNMSLKDKQNNIIGQKKPFEVIQYVYNCQILDKNDSAIINQAVQSIWKNKGYKDPLAETPKHAKVYKLLPNRPIKTLAENNLCKYLKPNIINETSSGKTKIVKRKDLIEIINECVNRYLRKYLNESSTIIPKYLYHATPSCYVKSIKKFGLGGKIPKKRFWDYNGTQYQNISTGCFLANDEYVAESYLEGSEEFEAFAEWFEERYDKELKIVVFQIETSKLDTKKLSIDSNNLSNTEECSTYFYDGVIPYKNLKIINLYS